MSRITESEVTDLPEPDSPTIATVSPGYTSNETLSTAVVVPRCVEKTVSKALTFRIGMGVAKGVRGFAFGKNKVFQENCTFLFRISVSLNN